MPSIINGHSQSTISRHSPRTTNTNAIMSLSLIDQIDLRKADKSRLIRQSQCPHYHTAATDRPRSGERDVVREVHPVSYCLRGSFEANSIGSRSRRPVSMQQQQQIRRTNPKYSISAEAAARRYTVDAPLRARERVARANAVNAAQTQSHLQPTPSFEVLNRPSRLPPPRSFEIPSRISGGYGLPSRRGAHRWPFLDTPTTSNAPSIIRTDDSSRPSSPPPRIPSRLSRGSVTTASTWSRYAQGQLLGTVEGGEAGTSSCASSPLLLPRTNLARAVSFSTSPCPSLSSSNANVIAQLRRTSGDFRLETVPSCHGQIHDSSDPAARAESWRGSICGGSMDESGSESGFESESENKGEIQSLRQENLRRRGMEMARENDAEVQQCVDLDQTSVKEWRVLRVVNPDETDDGDGMEAEDDEAHSLNLGTRWLAGTRGGAGDERSDRSSYESARTSGSLDISAVIFD